MFSYFTSLEIRKDPSYTILLELDVLPEFLCYLISHYKLMLQSAHLTRIYDICDEIVCAKLDVFQSKEVIKDLIKNHNHYEDILVRMKRHEKHSFIFYKNCLRMCNRNIQEQTMALRRRENILVDLKNEQEWLDLWLA